MSSFDTKVGSAVGTPLFRPATPVDAGASYARVVPVADEGTALLATCEAFELNGFPLFASSNAGSTWSPEPIAVVREPLGAADGWVLHWQPTLFFDSDRVLLAGTSIHRDGSGTVDGSRILLFESRDGGTSWAYLSTIAEGDGATGNVWEPELQRIGDRLVAFYSTEAHHRAGFHQAIAHRDSSDDGASWGPEALDIFAPDGHSRPGMPIVRRLADGTFGMAYEVCDVAGGHCRVYLTTSPDGLHWPHDPYAEPVASSPRHYLHSTPAMTVHEDHILVASMGAEGYANRVILTRTLTERTWRAIEAPVQWQGGNDHSGYSPALLALSDRLVHLASSALDETHNEMLYAVRDDVSFLGGGR